MGVDRKVIQEGNGKDYPKPGDNVTIEYTGNLWDPHATPHNQGKQFVPPTLQYTKTRKLTSMWFRRFDTSVGRGDFQTQIGVGKVIKGILNIFAVNERWMV